MTIQYTSRQVEDRLKQQIAAGRPLFIPHCGMGLSARAQEAGGADLILVSPGSYWRLKGLASQAAFLPTYDCNETVFQMAGEVLPVVKETPVAALLDPHNASLNLDVLCRRVKDAGLSAVAQLSAHLYGGEFFAQLNAAGMGLNREVELIRTAAALDLFTLAFALDEQEAESFAAAGAGAVCAHVGASGGGPLSLAQAAECCQQIFTAARRARPDILLFAHGGPIETPAQVGFIMQQTLAQGFVGGSAAESAPIKRAVQETTHAFKNFTAA